MTRPTRAGRGRCAYAGIALALGVFMIDAWRALPGGRDAVLRVLPTTFNWPLFWVALLLMATPVLHQLAISSAMRLIRRLAATPLQEIRSGD